MIINIWRKSIMLEKLSFRRISMAIIGVVLLGVTIAVLKLVGLGTDPFTCLNSGLSEFFHMDYGTFQLITSAILLLFMIAFGRNYIGLGTIINMVGVGYVAEFALWILHDLCQIPFDLPLWLRVILLLIAIVFAGGSLACYITPELGVSPYDSSGCILENKTNRPFYIWRIVIDVTAVVVGTAFAFIAGGWELVVRYTNIGTLILMMLTGPLISWMRQHVTEPILYKNGATDALRKRKVN